MNLRFASAIHRLPYMTAMALLAASAPPSVRGQNDDENQSAGRAAYPIRSTSVLARISFPDPTAALNHAAVDVLLNGAGVASRAAREVLGISLDEDPTVMQTQFVLPGDGEFSMTTNADGVTLLGILNVMTHTQPPQTEAKLEAFARRVCELLAEALPTGEPADRPGLLAELAQLHGEIREMQEREQALRKTGIHLRAEAGEIDITDWDHVLAMLKRLQEQRGTLEQQQMAREARRRALLEQIARVKQQVDEASVQAPAAAEFERIVALREQKLQYLLQLKEKGGASTTEIWQAEEDLAQARAELARQRQDAAASVGGGLLAKLNEELVMLAVAHEESAAALANTREQFGRYLAARDQATRYDHAVETELLSLSGAIQQALARARELEQRLRPRILRPRVDMLGMPPAASEPEPSKP